jgi:hypothetical protein
MTKRLLILEPKTEFVAIKMPESVINEPVLTDSYPRMTKFESSKTSGILAEIIITELAEREEFSEGLDRVALGWLVSPRISDIFDRFCSHSGRPVTTIYQNLLSGIVNTGEIKLIHDPHTQTFFLPLKAITENYLFLTWSNDELPA